MTVSDCLLFVPACKTWSTLNKTGEESWDCWAPGGGLANQAPGLTTFQVLHDKINSITGNQSCDFLTDWWWHQFAFWDYKQEPQTAVLLKEWVSYLGPFPSWGSRCSLSQGLLALLQSGCWSKSNLVMFLLFLLLLSLTVSILKSKQYKSLINMLYIFVYIEWLILLTNPLRQKWKRSTKQISMKEFENYAEIEK